MASFAGARAWRRRSERADASFPNLLDRIRDRLGERRHPGAPRREPIDLLAQGFMNLLRLPELFLGVPPSPVGQPRDGPLGGIKDVGEFRGRRRGAGALDRLDALRRIIQLGLEVAVPRLQFGGLDPPLVELGGEPPRPRPWPPSIPSTP